VIAATNGPVSSRGSHVRGLGVRVGDAVLVTRGEVYAYFEIAAFRPGRVALLAEGDRFPRAFSAKTGRQHGGPWAIAASYLVHVRAACAASAQATNDALGGVADRIHARLIALGWSERELDRRAGLARGQSSKLLARGPERASLAVNARVARALGVSLDWLAGVEGGRDAVATQALGAAVTTGAGR
jgi:hypothetical protein